MGNKGEKSSDFGLNQVKNFCFYEKGCIIAMDKRLISKRSPNKQLISYLPIPFNINQIFQK